MVRCGYPRPAAALCPQAAFTAAAAQPQPQPQNCLNMLTSFKNPIDKKWPER